MAKRSTERKTQSRTGPVGAFSDGAQADPDSRETVMSASAMGAGAPAPYVEAGSRDGASSLNPTKWLRFVLPLAALGLMAFVFTSSRPEVGGFELPIVDGELLALSAGMRVTNPQFSGATSAGEPFLIRAELAEPDSPDPDEIALTRIVGSITTEEGAKIGLTSETGLLEPKINAVRLSDGVRIVTDDGYVFETATLLGDAESRVVWSETPVRGYGPAGEITAERLEIDISGDGTAYFKGNVQVTIRQLVDQGTQ